MVYQPERSPLQRYMKWFVITVVVVAVAHVALGFFLVSRA